MTWNVDSNHGNGVEDYLKGGFFRRGIMLMVVDGVGYLTMVPGLFANGGRIFPS